MKWTVHQRLRAQRDAEHSRAKWRMHCRAVAREGGGFRCYDCRDVPLSELEKATMTADEWAWYREDMATYERWQADPIDPCADDPKRWHIQKALGYWS